VFNQLYTDRVKFLREYKARLEKEKFTEIDQERIVRLDEEIECLIQQERALFSIEENVLKTEHEELVGKLVQLQMERATWVAELVIKDSRIARTIELGAMLESQGGTILEFNEDLYSTIIEKIIVKERTNLEFYLKNGLCFEEHYTLKRGLDLF